MLQSTRSKKLVYYTILGFLAFLYIHTAVSKFIDFKGFRFDINNQPFPNSLTPFLIWALPLTEIGIAVCFFTEKARLIGLYASLILMSLFTIYAILILLHVFAYVPCGCGGFIKSLNWKEHLVLNLFLVTISYLGIRINKNLEASSLQIVSG